MLYGIFLSHLWTSWPGTFYHAKLLRMGEMSSTAIGFRLEGLTEAFHKFSRPSKIGVFRLYSPASCLPYSPLCPQWLLHVKRSSRPRSSNELHKREKYQISPILKTRGIMRTRRMTIEQGRRVGIDRFPNFHKSGSVKGMKRLYYGRDCLLVRCGSYIYNVSAEPRIYYQSTI